MNTNPLQKTIISAAIASALSFGATTANADIYEFAYANGGCTTLPPPGSCTGPGDGLFTMLSSTGIPLANTSNPYYSDNTWRYGLRTQMGGSLSYDSTTRAGAIIINPFDFFNGGPAVASGITFKKQADSDLILTQMGFSWGGSDISTQVVLDGSGLIAALPTIAINDTIDLASCTGGSLDGLCALPASNGIKGGTIPIGPAPLVTSSFNVAGATGVGTVLTDLSLGTDDSIGGSPMDNGPFAGFNANFDFTSLTLTGYNDTTKPVVTFSNAVVSIDLNGSFDGNNPGVSVTCTDNADGTGTLVSDGGSTDADLAFTVNAGDLAAIDSSVSGVYPVRYTCTDNASARTAITDDPNNPGNATVPADNTSLAATLNVIVADPNAPVITITNDGQPTQHEACTLYTDAGATVTDIQDDDATLTAALVIVDSITGTSPADGTPDASIQYDVTDLGANPVTAANPSGGPLPAVTRIRTVTFADTTGPVISIPGGIAETVESTMAATYTNPAATAVDANSNCNPVVGGVATTTDVVDFVVPEGDDTIVTTLRYFASDSATVPNQTQKNRVVTVERAEPVITLIGEAVLRLDVGDSYVETGMNVHDVQDGDLTAITTTGSTAATGAGAGLLVHTIDSSAVDTSTNGTYEVTYDVTDSDTNAATQVVRTVVVGAYAEASNFTMLDASGKLIGGTNDVVFIWDESVNTAESDLNFNMTILSALPQPFFGAVWTAHHTRAFGPGTYSFDTGCTVVEIETDGCAAGTASASGPAMSMTVADGQIGAHILFDYNGTYNIDVVVVWDKDAIWDDPDGDLTSTNKLYDGEAGLPPDPASPWKLVSRDVNGDGINGTPMVDGPFVGFYANFNAGPGGTVAPPEPITTTVTDTKLGGALSWLVLLGMLPLIGFFRRNNK